MGFSIRYLTHGQINGYTLERPVGHTLKTSLKNNKGNVEPKGVQSTYTVECRVSIFGITIMIWGSIPHNSTQDLLGKGPPGSSAACSGAAASAAAPGTAGAIRVRRFPEIPKPLLPGLLGVGACGR